jgi:phosphate starvation-inducible protein PhoH
LCHAFITLQQTIREARNVLSQKTQLNTELIDRKTDDAQELVLLAGSKERNKELLQKVFSILLLPRAMAAAVRTLIDSGKQRVS